MGKNKQNYKEEENIAVQEKGKNSSKSQPGQKKRQRKRKGRMDDTRVKRYETNDHNWYFKDQVIMDQVSSFTFNEFIGSDVAEKLSIPHSMRLMFNPCPGWSDPENAPDSGINVAAMRFYTVMSSLNNKTTAYTTATIATLMLALGDIISYSEWLRRSLKLAFTYNIRNWAYPDDILNVCGISGMTSNLAQKRMDFNYEIQRLNRIAFPSECSWFKKCQFMYSNLYLDSESPMSQTYVFVPFSYWRLKEATASTGTVLESHNIFEDANNNDISWKTITWNEALGNLRGMINDLLEAATFQYVYADVLKAFSDSELLHMPYITEGEILIPIYDPMVNLQIDNATITGAPDYTGDPDFNTGLTPGNSVYEEAGRDKMIYCPQFLYTKTAYPDVSPARDILILNFPNSLGNPDTAQRIESTRMSSLCYYTQESASSPLITKKAALPDHYLVRCYIYCKNEFTNQTAEKTLGIRGSFIGGAAVTDNGTLAIVDALSKFQAAPRLRFEGNAFKAEPSYTGDLDFWTTIDMNYLYQTDNLIYASMFSL